MNGCKTVGIKYTGTYMLRKVPSIIATSWLRAEERQKRKHNVCIWEHNNELFDIFKHTCI